MVFHVVAYDRARRRSMRFAARNAAHAWQLAEARLHRDGFDPDSAHVRQEPR